MVLLRETTKDDPNRIELATRKGTPIPNTQIEEYAPFRAKALIEDLHKQFSQIAELRSVSQIYNCVGLVFGVRRTFISDDDVEWILDEDGYKRVPDAQVVIGDVIAYRRISENKIIHVGVVVGTRFDASGLLSRLILSKWGHQGGEYLHLPTSVPPYYLIDAAVEYWSERYLP